MSRKTRRRYTTEFKAEAVKLVLESQLSCAQAARDLGIPESVLSRWVHRAREVAGGGLTEAERQELRRLRRENKVLKQERDILKKAAAFFARENL